MRVMTGQTKEDGEDEDKDRKKNKHPLLKECPPSTLAQFPVYVGSKFI